jgi:mannan endo-1,4-beta-mannosidase
MTCRDENRLRITSRSEQRTVSPTMLLLLATMLAASAPLARAFSFGGANSYYLYTYQSDEQLQVLDAMKAAGLRTLRIFISQQWANQKGSSNVAVSDVEHPVGTYDDSILNMIDSLMVRSSQRGIKLIIALHDRYSLGCWSTDSYVSKYNIPTTNNCGGGDIGANDLSGFYNNAAAAADMDRRFAHIVSHRNPAFSSRPWSAIPEAILGFDIQNEGQAHQRNGNIPNPSWVCSRAKQLKPLLAAGVLIHTGGGADIWDSVLSQHFACPAIDVVSVHSYNAGDWGSKLPPVVQTAKQAGKRIIVEEFGATGRGNKASSLRAQIAVFQSLGVPWMVWQVGRDAGWGAWR